MANTYNTDLQANNTSLEDILDTINNLPEAGLQTATLDLRIGSTFGAYYYCDIDSKTMVSAYGSGVMTSVYHTVPVGSLLICSTEEPIADLSAPFQAVSENLVLISNLPLETTKVGTWCYLVCGDGYIYQYTE